MTVRGVGYKMGTGRRRAAGTPGSLAGRDLEVFFTVLPFLAVGVIGTLLLGHQLNILSLGDEAARALGISRATVYRKLGRKN